MKKLFAAIIASVLLFPAFTTTDAHAGGPYPGSVNTTTNVSAPAKVKRGKGFTVTARLRVSSSAASTCRGTYVIRVQKNGKTKTRTASVPPPRASFNFRLGSVGGWRIKARYVPRAGSPCQPSSKSRTITVRR